MEISLNRNGKIFGCTDSTSGLNLYHLEKRKEVYKIPSLGNQCSFETIDFSKDSHLLSFGSSDGLIQTWRIQTNQQVFSIQEKFRDITQV